MGQCLSCCYDPFDMNAGPTKQRIQEWQQWDKDIEEFEAEQRVEEQKRRMREKYQFEKEAQAGVVFIKHGRRGDPHERLVTIDKKGEIVHYTTGTINFNNITKIYLGKHTEVFRRVLESQAPDAHCFSVATHDRTLDLQAPDQETRDRWVNGLHLETSAEIAADIGVNDTTPVLGSD